MTAAAAAAVGQAFRVDRRLPGAVVAAVLLHGLLFWQARAPVSGERLLESVPAISVRMVAVPAAATASVETVVPEAQIEAMPVQTPAPATPEPAQRAVEPVAAMAAPRPSATPPPPPAPAEVAPAAPVPTVPVAPAGLPDAPDYALAARLDPGPQPLDDINPEYPEGAELRSGIVVLRLLVSETGRVDNVAVVRAQPPGVFDKAAATAFEAARFSPGRLFGTPVKSQLTIEVAFTPLNRGPRVSGRGY